MKTLKRLFIAPARWLAALGLVASAGSALAFPPAPHHLFEGTVRDQLGNPIVVTNAVVVFETLAGSQVKTVATPNLAPGVNYRLAVPMDAGLTADNYQATAVRPTVAFRFKVQIGTTTYLPIELKGSYAGLGKPSETTHLDLTLGVDADGDGLPDAWEQMLIDMLGLGGLTDVDPNADNDNDGLSNLQEYLAGTYAFDPEDGFRLDVVGAGASGPLMEFLAIRGRTYTVLESTDLKNWSASRFRVPAEGAAASTRTSYAASDVRVLRVEAEVPASAPDETPAPKFYKLKVQ
jgi:Bacterial TSP3 repeat